MLSVWWVVLQVSGGVPAALRHEDGLSMCAQLPAGRRIVKRWGPTADCQFPAAVMEWFPFHDEVIPTAVKLLMSAGADCIALLKRVGGMREFDVFSEIRRWSPNFVLIHGQVEIDKFLQKTSIRLIVVNTFQDAQHQDLRVSTRHNLEMIVKHQPTAKVVVGCHNLEPHIALLRNWSTHLNLTSMVFHPVQRSNLDKATEGLSVGPAFASVPFYFGPDRFYRTNDYDAPLRIMGVGEIDAKRRDYSVIAQLGRVQLAHRVELVLFGRPGPNNEIDIIQSMVDDIPNVTVSFQQGRYLDLYSHVADASYVAPYLDDHSTDSATAFPNKESPGDALLYHREYVTGKLSSALAIAAGFQVPVIGCANVLHTFGIEGQIEVAPDGSDFGVRVAEAVSVYYNDRPRYMSMRLAQCEYRAAHFQLALDRIAGLLESATPLLADPVPVR